MAFLGLVVVSAYKVEIFLKNSFAPHDIDLFFTCFHVYSFDSLDLILLLGSDSCSLLFVYLRKPDRMIS